VASIAATPVSPSRELASVLELVDDDDDHDDWVVITGDEAGVVIIVAVAATVAVVGVLTKDNASLPEEPLLLLLPLTVPPSFEQVVTPAKQMSPSAQPYPSGQDWTHAVEASS
jgi:hypothetical protein